MSPSRDPSPKSGKIVRTPGGHWAFVPDPLPPAMDFDPVLIGRLADAERSLGRLAGMAATHPTPWVPTGALMRREAVLSCRLDGTQASLSDLVLFEAAPSAQVKFVDAREVANYFRALDHGLAHARRTPVGIRLMRDLHRILMTGLRRRHVTPGEFRKARPPTDPPGCMLEHAVFLPPPVREMRVALSGLEKHLRAPSVLPPLVRLALIHCQFQTIHPFPDGNGRVGRLLISLLLREWGLLRAPLLSLSAHFMRHSREHDDRLLDVGRTGAWEPWVGFFLTGVANQARDGVRRAVKLRRLRDEYLARLRRAPSRALLIDLVEGLFDRPAASVAGVARRLKVTRRAAAIHLDRLVDTGILSAAADGGRGEVHLARDVIRVIEEDLKPEATPCL